MIPGNVAESDFDILVGKTEAFEQIPSEVDTNSSAGGSKFHEDFFHYNLREFLCLRGFMVKKQGLQSTLPGMDSHKVTKVFCLNPHLSILLSFR